MHTDRREMTFKLDMKCTKKFTAFFADFDKAQTKSSLGVESY